MGKTKLGTKARTEGLQRKGLLYSVHKTIPQVSLENCEALINCSPLHEFG